MGRYKFSFVSRHTNTTKEILGQVLQVQCSLAARLGLALTYLGLGLGKFRLGGWEGSSAAAVCRELFAAPPQRQRDTSAATERDDDRGAGTAARKVEERLEMGREKKKARGRGGVVHMRDAEFSLFFQNKFLIRSGLPAGRPANRRWRSGSVAKEEDRGKRCSPGSGSGSRAAASTGDRPPVAPVRTRA